MKFQLTCCRSDSDWLDSSLQAPDVYDSWKLITDGPIRAVFELTYDKSCQDAGQSLIETKRVTIDRGQQLFRFDCIVYVPENKSIELINLGADASWAITDFNVMSGLHSKREPPIRGIDGVLSIDPHGSRETRAAPGSNLVFGFRC